MAKGYGGSNAFSFLISIIKNALREKVNTKDIVNTLDSADFQKPLSAAQGKVLSDRINTSNNQGMKRSVYDTNDNGVVDNSEKLDGHGADYFAKSDVVDAYMAENKGQPNGIVPLDANKKISSEYLPSYVDDVVEGYLHNGSFYEDEDFEKLIEPEKSKIYTDLPTNIPYRWGGSSYIQIVSSDMVELSNEQIQALWDSIP